MRIKTIDEAQDGLASLMKQAMGLITQIVKEKPDTHNATFFGKLIRHKLLEQFLATMPEAARKIGTETLMKQSGGDRQKIVAVLLNSMMESWRKSQETKRS